MVIVDSARHVVGGVDTHRDVNVAAVVDMNGGLLGVESFRTTADGHRAGSAWMAGFGVIERVGVEGTGARLIDRTVRLAAGTASPISSTPSRQPAPPCRAAVRVAPSPVTGD